jgi:ribosomal protein S18 acetylase RimI-like enzyme
MKPTRPIVSLRAAAEPDLPRLLEMMADFNREDGIAWDAAGVSPVLRRLMADPSLGAVRLVDVDGDLAGYFVLTWGFDLEWRGRDSFLTEIYVAPAARSRGVATEMMRLIEDLARSEGARAVHLMVRPENTPAVKLYARAGYASPPRTLLSKALG